MMNRTEYARTMTRFTVRPAIALLLAASLLANVALAVVALNVSGNLPAIRSQTAPAALPQAYVAERAGEGPVGPTISRSVSTIQAFTQPYMGEGRTNVAALRAVEALPFITYDAQPYMGEGRANVAALRAIDALPFITYDAPLGMGEGWVGGIAPHDAATSPALIAYSSCGQGEGLVQQRVPIEDTCR